MKNCSGKVYIKKSIKNSFKGGFIDPKITREADLWEVDSDELNNASFDSDREEERKKVSFKIPKKSVKKRSPKYQHEVDTNVMSINLSVLKNNNDVVTGDPIFCTNCSAVFNCFSKLTNDEDAENHDTETVTDVHKQFWMCEFCQTKNLVFIENEEIPTKESLNYLLEADEVDEEVKEGLASDNDTSLIF